jgi:hypothetical protein
LQPFPLLKYGTLRCSFKKGSMEKELCLFYQVEDDHVVTWLADDS